jgi:hypothetical protein
MTALEKLIDNVTDAVNMKEAGEVLCILMSLMVSAAIAAEIDEEELESFAVESIRKSYGSLTPSDNEHLH